MSQLAHLTSSIDIVRRPNLTHKSLLRMQSSASSRSLAQGSCVDSLFTPGNLPCSAGFVEFPRLLKVGGREVEEQIHTGHRPVPPALQD